MEPIGATASVIALIKTTKFLARSIQSLYLRWRHAPSDLHTLAALLLSIEARLDVIASTSATGHPLIINDESRRNLENLLKEAGECVGQFEDILARVQRYGSLRQRAMWAMQESQRMDKTTARLRTLEDRLSAWLQVLSLCVGTARQNVKP